MEIMDKFLQIEKKHKKIINRALQILSNSSDCEHGLPHTLDVVCYTKKLIDMLDCKFDKEVCLVSAYWHDVGRVFSNKDHEALSAKMLSQELSKMGYEQIFIENCYNAIIHHRWNQSPQTIEGKIVRDADKIAFVGLNRWKECLNNNKNLDSIIQLLPHLRNQLLYFTESRMIYDEEIIKVLELLYLKK